jgi:membrane-associated progesterone receptor component
MQDSLRKVSGETRPSPAGAMFLQITESLLLPLNSVLFISSVYLAFALALPRSGALKKNAPIPTSFEQCYSWKPPTHPPVAVFRKYTPKSLEPFDGKDGGRILLSIDRKVFDVTAGRSFYGPGEHLTHRITRLWVS